MKLADKITAIIIHMYEWAEGLDPHKVANEITWYGGIQAYILVIHWNKWIDWAWDLTKVVALPLFIWVCLFFFKILVKWSVAKYLPGLKKYFHHKDESDE